MAVFGLIQVGEHSDYPLEALGNNVSKRLRDGRVRVVEPFGWGYEEAYNSYRHQYHSTMLLSLLEKKVEAVNVERLLGVAAFDLYVPGVNFIFGEARLPGRVGVISTHRLKPLSPTESGLLERRVVKESIHEFGHMLGLKHCSDDRCVMRFSERLEHTDKKSEDYCTSCSSKLESFR